MENKFKVGDRVECIKKGSFANIGEKGTIVEIGETDAIINWDNDVGGWSDNDLKIQGGHGEWKDFDNIKLLEDDHFDAEKGIMLAMLKSFGVSYQEIADLVKNAKIIKHYKITLTEFWNSKEQLVIHCDTEDKANKLLKTFDKLGIKYVKNKRN